MNKYIAIGLVGALAACGGSDERDGWDDLNEENPQEDVGDAGDGLQLGVAQQPIHVQQLYGVQRSNAGRQLRCVAGASSDCMVPKTRKLEFSPCDANGIALDADRVLWCKVYGAEIGKADAVNNRFRIRVEPGDGTSGETLCQIRPQEAFTPASSSTADIRHYVGGYGYSGIVDFGPYSQFGVLIVRGDFAAMKAFKGGTCADTATNQCVRGMRHMIQAGIAACAGTGLTSNAGANGTGVDVDLTTAHPTFSDPWVTAGDACRQNDYDEASPGFGFAPDICGGAGS